VKTRTLDDTTRASDPGGLTLSHERMREFHPDLYEKAPFLVVFHRETKDQRFWHARHEEHLRHGDSRAAVVVSIAPLLVAAYTDELDCVALLKFPIPLVERYRLRVGTRLLTVNLYSRGDDVAADLIEGPQTLGRYVNFTPMIADFVSDDVALIAARKTWIPESEWLRTEQLGSEYLASRGQIARDGRPLRSMRPAEAVT